MALGKDVRRATREAWKDTLEVRKQTLRELRKKNTELKRQLRGKKKSGGKKS